MSNNGFVGKGKKMSLRRNWFVWRLSVMPLGRRRRKLEKQQ